MPTWLATLIGILVVLGIVVLIFIAITFRRINIVFKKIDYLAEDLTYKTESLSSVLEAINGVAKYVNLIHSLIDESGDEKRRQHIKQNRKKILEFANYLKKVAAETENDQIK